MNKRERLSERTIDLINRGRYIFLKRGEWYLGQWTNIAGGPDAVSWSKAPGALEIENLEWAFALAKLYSTETETCKVVTRKR